MFYCINFISSSFPLPDPSFIGRSSSYETTYSLLSESKGNASKSKLNVWDLFALRGDIADSKREFVWSSPSFKFLNLGSVFKLVYFFKSS